MSRAPVAVVTGANKGVGLELVRQLAGRQYRVFACARQASDPGALAGPRFAELIALSRQAGVQIELVDLDIANGASRTSAAAFIAARTDRVDHLWNNAGIIAIENQFTAVTEENMTACFQVNCMGMLLFTQALFPLIVASDQKLIANVTSGFASIGDNTSGRYYSYRISKAGMSMATKCLALDAERDGTGVLCIAIEPGWVATDMGLTDSGWTEGQPLPDGMVTPASCVQDLLAVAAAKGAADQRASANGKLLWKDGSEMPH